MTEQQLKEEFRQRAKELHPDVNKSHDAHQKFIKLREEFELALQTLQVEEHLENHAKTTDGHYFTSLGKGWPIGCQTQTCAACGGKGYKTKYLKRLVSEWPKCYKCWGWGCMDCNYTGNFTKHGKKTLEQETGEIETYFCKECQGKGQIRLGNPVINLDCLSTKRPHARERNK